MKWKYDPGKVDQYVGYVIAVIYSLTLVYGAIGYSWRDQHCPYVRPYTVRFVAKADAERDLFVPPKSPLRQMLDDYKDLRFAAQSCGDQ